MSASAGCGHGRFGAADEGDEAALPHAVSVVPPQSGLLVLRVQCRPRLQHVEESRDGAGRQRGRLGALVREPLFSKENQRPGGLAPPAPGPDGAVGLPDP
jgi:hypothetical protein